MKTIVDAAGVAGLIDRLADELCARLGGQSSIAVIGIRKGGLALSQRLCRMLSQRGLKVDRGTVDIGLYRDDAHLTLPRPQVGITELDFPIDGRHVVLVDDVFWTGRTARAAIDAVLDYGRPRRLWLLTLAARAGSELPIRPDFVGIDVEAEPSERVELRLDEHGREDGLVVALRNGGR
jgi:pyrimidine operon attenuation protein/uracil phosphoribosyltransferase